MSDDFEITPGRAFAGDGFEESRLLKGDQPSGGGWQKTQKGWRRRHGGKYEYYYPHPDGKPGKRISRKSDDAESMAKRLKGKGATDKDLRTYLRSMHGMPFDDATNLINRLASESREKDPPKFRFHGQNKWHQESDVPGVSVAEAEVASRAVKSEDTMDQFDELMKAAGAAAGWEPIPSGKKGGKRRRKAGGGYEYDYTDIAEYKMRVHGEGHKEVAESTKKGIEKSADICKVTPPVCAGNLGIPRSDMPQLEDDVVQNFLGDLEKEGHKVEEGRTQVGQLKATQREINAEKVKGMASAHEEYEKKGKEGWSPGKNPIIISSDNYVLDGHHRWAAMLHIGPGETMPTRRVSMPMKELLKRAKSYKGVTQAGFGDPSAAKKSLIDHVAWCDRLNKAVDAARINQMDQFDSLLIKAKVAMGGKCAYSKLMSGKMVGKMCGKCGTGTGKGCPMRGKMVGKEETASGDPVMTRRGLGQGGVTATGRIVPPVATPRPTGQTDVTNYRTKTRGLHGKMKGKVVAPSDASPPMTGKQERSARVAQVRQLARTTGSGLPSAGRRK